MSYVAKDGRHFTHGQQGRKYDNYLAEQGRDAAENAPGGDFADAAMKEHGNVRRVVIEREGNGRHRVTVEHFDGHESTQVHPEAHLAHQVAAHFLGVDNPPPAVQTHSRSRAYPIGPKEHERLKREDNQEVEES